MQHTYNSIQSERKCIMLAVVLGMTFYYSLLHFICIFLCMILKISFVFFLPFIKMNNFLTWGKMLFIMKQKAESLFPDAEVRGAGGGGAGAVLTPAQGPLHRSR